MADDSEHACEEFKAFEAYVQENLRTQDTSGVDYLTELEDSPEELAAKVTQLVEWIREAEGATMAYTGAGVSTSCGLPDYRGPDGVWTRRARGEHFRGLEEEAMLHAKPSLTHLGLAALRKVGLLSFLCTTNVDSIHLRAGGFTKGEDFAELHGNLFTEECAACGVEFQRGFVARRADAGHYDHDTGRACDACGETALRDNIVNFGNTFEHVPSMEGQYDLAWVAATKAKVMVVLGSSLSVETACSIPDFTAEKGGRVVIVNRQRTPKDHLAALTIHAPCDDVMRTLLAGLGVPEPPRPVA